MSQASMPPDDKLSVLLEENHACLLRLFDNCDDFIAMDASFGQLKGLFVYFRCMIDHQRLNEIRRSLSRSVTELGDEASPHTALRQAMDELGPAHVFTFRELTEELSMGNPVLLIDGEAAALSFALSNRRKRAIEEPVAESVVRGPRDGFTEALEDNVAMLRRRLRTADLKIKTSEIGRLTRTAVVIAYIEGLAAPGLIREIEARLSKIDADGILESGNIEEVIEDQPYSPFPQIMATERPDTAAACLLEGRAVILTDGTPFSLIAPISLFSLLQSPEDYYQRYLLSTAIRWLRYLFFVVALLVPSAYVAILTYHQEMIPTPLLLSIAKSREQIPFPALIEALIMEIMFEALREAGVRLPKQVGAAVSIVGALVIGQAATSAGLVSSPMVMVVAITGIASFMAPNYTLGISVRLLRFPIMLLAGMLGLLGLSMGIMAIVIHLCTLRSFGLPYLSPIAPLMHGEWADVLVREPAWKPARRPRLTGSGGGWRRKPDFGPASRPGRRKGGQ